MNTILLQYLEVFARVWMLPVAALCGALVAVITWQVDSRRRARLGALGDVPVLERLVPRRRGGLPPRARAVLLGAAAMCLGIALAGPRWGERAERRRDVGVDICVEQIEELLETPGISGIDIMDIDPARYEEIVERCGLRVRRQAAIG